MQEASSLSKAIDQAWTRAGKPAEFTVKILEEPEHNMFGLTTKPAKIAFFFDERATVLTTAKPAEHKPRQQRPSYQKTQKPVDTYKKPEPQPTPAKAVPSKDSTQPAAPQKRQKWNDEMIGSAEQWLKSALSMLQKDISFSTTTSGNNITFRLNGSPTGDQNKDRLLFAGFAYLIMATLRNRFKKSLRFHKVVLITS